MCPMLSDAAQHPAQVLSCLRDITLLYMSVEMVSVPHQVRLSAGLNDVAQHPQGPSAAASKEAMLLALCAKAFAGGRTIVFFRTKASIMLRHQTQAFSVSNIVKFQIQCGLAKISSFLADRRQWL